MNLPSLNHMLKHQTFHQLHAVFINGQITTLSHGHYGHMPQVGGGLEEISWALSLFRAGWLLWMAVASHFSLKVTHVTVVVMWWSSHSTIDKGSMKLLKCLVFQHTCSSEKVHSIFIRWILNPAIYMLKYNIDMKDIWNHSQHIDHGCKKKLFDFKNCHFSIFFRS